MSGVVRSSDIPNIKASCKVFFFLSSSMKQPARLERQVILGAASLRCIGSGGTTPSASGTVGIQHARRAPAISFPAYRRQMCSVLHNGQNQRQRYGGSLLRGISSRRTSVIIASCAARSETRMLKGGDAFQVPPNTPHVCG